MTMNITPPLTAEMLATFMCKITGRRIGLTFINRAEVYLFLYIENR